MSEAVLGVATRMTTISLESVNRSSMPTWAVAWHNFCDHSPNLSDLGRLRRKAPAKKPHFLALDQQSPEEASFYGP